MKKPLLQGNPTTFTELFPEVKSLELTVQEHGEFSSFAPSVKSSIHFTKSSIPSKITCSNPKCQQGGYELQWILTEVIRKKDRKYKSIFHCNGHEGTPKGRRIGDPCCNNIEIEIDIDYEK